MWSGQSVARASAETPDEGRDVSRHRRLQRPGAAAGTTASLITSDQNPATRTGGAMTLIERLQRFEGMIFGFMMGAGLAVLAIFLWHQAVGMTHVSAWKRAVADQNLARIAALLDDEVTLAETAFADGRPLAVSEHLAFDFAPTLYRHHMRYARFLLEQGDVDRFNELRLATGFMLLDLSGETLAGLSLAGSDFSGAALERTDLSGADLSGCGFVGADMPSANLTGARIDHAHFDQANLAGAILTGVTGADATFTQAVLASASLQQITGLTGARLDSAEMAEANLYASRLEGAVLDGASLLLASAVGADLSTVASMVGVDLTGANLNHARLAPDRMARAWITGAEGLDDGTVRELVVNGAVVKPPDVLELVDPRIVEGFRAQAEREPTIPPDARERVLISWLKGYYLQ
jgi:uncharacterized protein YjbI with pentapeptide repeats